VVSQRGESLHQAGRSPWCRDDRNVLLYHVVPGATITYRQALKSNGAVLQTALSGATIKVKVKCALVILKDSDPDARNPVVIAPNLNRGNKQIGHRINRVLRPVDL
jgi:uncharacterized surface protein with fasciclin (FAS1) repeats